MEVENIISEIAQINKDKYCFISHSIFSQKWPEKALLAHVNNNVESQNNRKWRLIHKYYLSAGTLVLVSTHSGSER